MAEICAHDYVQRTGSLQRGDCMTCKDARIAELEAERDALRDDADAHRELLEAAGKDYAALEALRDTLLKANHELGLDRAKVMRERDEWRTKAFHPSGQKLESVLSELVAERDHYRERAASNAQQAKDERHLKAEAEKALSREYARGLEDAARVADEWAGNYPTDVFPPTGTGADAISARMARHTSAQIASRIRSLKAEPSTETKEETT